MSSTSSTSFPVQCLDVRSVSYMEDPHVVAVLQGSSSPPARPLFSLGNTVCNVRVDQQGLWGPHEWHLLPQLYDFSSPWLCFIPIYRDSHHISRSTIHRHTIIQMERTTNMSQKEPLLYTAEPDFKEKMTDYVKGVIALAEGSMQALQLVAEGMDRVVWPTDTLERATLLSRQLRAGVTSGNTFIRAVTSLRRAVLELEGFHIWATVMKAPPLNRAQIASFFREEKKVIYRGAYLWGSVQDWLNEGSEVRRSHAHLVQCNAPLYTLLRKGDWNMPLFLNLKPGNLPFSEGRAIEGVPTCYCD